MDPYWNGGTLKAPAVQKKRQATLRRKPPIASAQHPESGVRDVMVCGGQECGGWHIVGPCRTIRRLTARVRASPWRNSEGRESAESTIGSIASAWRWRHLEATGAHFTTWRLSPTGGLSTVVAGCADAALNLTPDTAPAPSVGRGRPGGKDASATRRCALITGRPGSWLATVTTATQLGRLGMLGSAKARGRDGRDTSCSRSLMYALSSRPGAPLSLTTLTSEPRTMREWRHSPATSSSIAWRASN